MVINRKEQGMKTPLEKLAEARELLRVSQWERVGNYSCDILGRSVPPRSKNAISYCALGVVEAVAESSEEADFMGGVLLEALRRRDPNNLPSVTTFNDKTAKNKNDVLSLFDEAAEIAESYPREVVNV